MTFLINHFDMYTKQKQFTDMIAIEYVRYDDRKTVLVDVFRPANQLNPLAKDDRFVTEQIKDVRNNYPIILTVKKVKDDYIYPVEFKGGSIHILNCKKLLED